MASLTDLATILAEQDDYYAKNDPFLQGSQALYGGLKNIQDYNLSPWEKIAAGLVAGIGGGLMNGVGTARVDSKKQALAKSLSDLMTGADSDAIVKENPDAAKFLPTIRLTVAQNRLDDEREAKKAQRALSTDLLKEGLTLDTSGKFQAIPGYAEALAQKELLKKQAELQATNQTLKDSPIGSLLSSVPSNLQDDVIKQQAQQASNTDIDGFINTQFEKAKGIGTVSAAIPGSTSANEMTGIGITLTTAIQAMLGREMNAKEQERLATAVPDWNDSVGQIELKKLRFKQLAQAIAPKTPLADSLTAAMVKPTQSAAPSELEQGPPAGETLPNGLPAPLANESPSAYLQRLKGN